MDPFGLSRYLHPCFVYVRSEGSDMTALMGRLVRAFAACRWGLYQNLIRWLKYACSAKQWDMKSKVLFKPIYTSILYASNEVSLQDCTAVLAHCVAYCISI